MTIIMKHQKKVKFPRKKLDQINNNNEEVSGKSKNSSKILNEENKISRNGNEVEESSDPVKSKNKRKSTPLSVNGNSTPSSDDGKSAPSSHSLPVAAANDEPPSSVVP